MSRPRRRFVIRLAGAPWKYRYFGASWALSFCRLSAIPPCALFRGTPAETLLRVLGVEFVLTDGEPEA